MKAVKGLKQSLLAMITLMSLIGVSPAFAQGLAGLSGPTGEPSPTPAPFHDLSSVMKELKPRLELIGKQMRSPATNPSSAKLAAECAEIAKAALGFTPELITKLPVADQAKALESFKSQINGLSEEFHNLQVAFEKNDANLIRASVQKILDMRKKGHTDFIEKD